MSSFKVSVIIPVYNAEKYVARAINSALNLPETAEIIIVEDKSPDNALNLCLKLAENDSRIKVFQHHDKQNHGAGASRNLGIVNASSEYISFLDADDYFLPNRFITDRLLFEEFNDIDGVYNAVGTIFYENVDSSLFSKEHVTTLIEIVEPKMLCQTLISGKKGWIHLNGLTLKNNLKNQDYLFDKQLEIGEDTDFIIRLSNNRKLIGGEIFIPVAMRGVHKENRVSNTSLMQKNRKILFEKLLNWAIKENLGLMEKRHLWHEYYYYSTLGTSFNYFTRYKALIFQLIKYPFIFTYNRFYKQFPIINRIFI
jgi:glycosyltransferase involved in cell wall biosynthesis